MYLYTTPVIKSRDEAELYFNHIKMQRKGRTDTPQNLISKYNFLCSAFYDRRAGYFKSYV